MSLKWYSPGQLVSSIQYSNLAVKQVKDGFFSVFKADLHIRMNQPSTYHFFFNANYNWWNVKKTCMGLIMPALKEYTDTPTLTS